MFEEMTVSRGRVKERDDQLTRGGKSITVPLAYSFTHFVIFYVVLILMCFGDTFFGTTPEVINSIIHKG